MTAGTGTYGTIDPASARNPSGAAPDPRTSRVHPERDQAELELLAAALADGLPILGICRGMQLINVARGGTLHQDLAAEAGHRRQQHGNAARLGDLLDVAGGQQRGRGPPGGPLGRLGVGGQPNNRRAHSGVT